MVQRIIMRNREYIKRCRTRMIAILMMVTFWRLAMSSPSSAAGRSSILELERFSNFSLTAPMPSCKDHDDTMTTI